MPQKIKPKKGSTMEATEIDIAQQDTQDLRAAAQDFKLKAKAAGVAAVDMSKAAYSQLQNKTRNCSQATDKVIRNSPYISLGVAFGAGLLIGVLAARRKTAA
jgi:ElaB/YqjD/DUF883 family membrane-anchored ribosome-binding protein